VKDSIGKFIKRIRESKNFTQDDMAYELGISRGGYNKIESGKTNVSIKRLHEIAQILEVNITSFFEESTLADKDGNKDYGYASKSDVENLSHLVNSLMKEMEKLRSEMHGKQVKKKSKK
jgi:transcriptional regulator with XRE-family HTH domain